MPDASDTDDERRRLFFLAVLGGTRAPHVPEGLLKPPDWKQALPGMTRRSRFIVYGWTAFSVVTAISVVGGVASGNGVIVAYVLAGLLGLNAAAAFVTLIWLLVAALYRRRRKRRASPGV